MTNLWLLRHAKAEPEGERADRDRALEAKGERAMRSIAAWAAEKKLAPTLVLCSPATRTRQTLALLIPALAEKPEIRFEEGLYLADAEHMLSRLRRVPERYRNVLLVGHNPGLHELAVRLMQPGAGALGRRLADGMPTGALAGFEFEGPWAALDQGTARLRSYVTRKELSD